MSHNIYDPEADQRRLAYWTKAPAPRQTYGILFTPRSGSSWLTSILTRTKAMGTPGEWFNPDLMPSSSRTKGARDLDQFVAAISRHEIHGGIFGFEATHHHIRAVFGGDDAFLRYFQDARYFWLIRRDIVAQAVSLDKMIRTGVGHSANSGRDDLERSDRSYDYNGAEILRWLRHIRIAEQGTERLIAHASLRPVRLSYEQITAAGAAAVTRLFADTLGATLPPDEALESDHRKIATEKNSAFAERFRRENRAFVDDIEAARAPMLALHP